MEGQSLTLVDMKLKKFKRTWNSKKVDEKNSGKHSSGFQFTVENYYVLVW